MALGARSTGGSPRGEKLEKFSSYTTNFFCYNGKMKKKLPRTKKVASVIANNFFQRSKTTTTIKEYCYEL